MKLNSIKDNFQYKNKLNTLELIDRLPANNRNDGKTISRFNILGMGSFRWCAVPSSIKKGDTFDLYLRASTKHGVDYLTYENQTFEQNIISSLIAHQQKIKG